MKRATTFMIEKVAHKGAFVWNYLPDLSRRWGELEARETMIWIQPPGTPTMGHLFLDAYHSTGDEYYYRAAEQVAAALTYAQLPSGGWNYVADWAGDTPLRAWYDTIGRNAWRLEEFQHFWGNATFDDGGTSSSATLLARMYLEKRDPALKAALDKAIRFVLDSQHPVGAWPQRFPAAQHAFTKGGRPDYTSYLTFNDDVTAGNIEFLILAYQGLRDTRLLEPIRRGMLAFVATRMPPPQAGWALQYTPDLQPAGARGYEPKALATHTTAACVEQLLGFYRLTGDARLLAPIPDALDWLDSVRLPAGLATAGRTHPTFIEIGTNRPLYLHRRGSNVVNGEYYVDADPTNTISHYGSTRQIDVANMRAELAKATSLPAADLAKHSPLAPGTSPSPLPRYFEVRQPREFGRAGAAPVPAADRAARAIAALDPQGRWITELGSTSHPYRGPGPKTLAPGDFAGTNVGDDSDTSPFRPTSSLPGISTQAYIRNMGDLIRFVDQTPAR
jgi:PelA/Pel-15E family pectate lyase